MLEQESSSKTGRCLFFLPASLSTHAEKRETVMLILQFPKHQKLDVKVKSANLFTVSCLEPTFHHFTLETANVYSKCVGSSRNLDLTFCHFGRGGKVEGFLLTNPGRSTA